jgi:hypothetical protein
MNLLLLMSMVRFNDNFLFAAGLAFFIGGFFTGSIISYFFFGACLGLLIKHAIEDSKAKK